MVTCYLCERNIQKGKRVVYDGIKYECVTEEDVQLCEEILEERDKKEFDLKQEKLSKLCDNKNVMNCKNCNKYFEVIWIIETLPLQAKCSYCKAANRYG